MSSRPVVSVMMPCYNARESLPWALASLLAQTFEDWELVLVDDGSTDHPEEVVEQASDPRIRLIRLPENRGRGHARQVALDNARGEYIAMLDADDWMYPERIEREVGALQSERSLALVSAGMAIVDCDNELVGVRLIGEGTPEGPFQGVVAPVAHAPSMYRRSFRDTVAFDTSLRMGEDQDFLLRLLRGKQYLILPEALYAYAEFGSVSAAKAAGAQRYARSRLRKHLRSEPWAASAAIARSFAKQGAYQVAAALHMDERVIRNRSEPATAQQRAHFDRARACVTEQVALHFGGELMARQCRNASQ